MHKRYVIEEKWTYGNNVVAALDSEQAVLDYLKHEMFPHFSNPNELSRAVEDRFSVSGYTITVCDQNGMAYSRRMSDDAERKLRKIEKLSDVAWNAVFVEFAKDFDIDLEWSIL